MLGCCLFDVKKDAESCVVIAQNTVTEQHVRVWRITLEVVCYGNLSAEIALEWCGLAIPFREIGWPAPVPTLCEVANLQVVT